jgi:hypothetical protein
MPRVADRVLKVSSGNACLPRFGGPALRTMALVLEPFT